MITRFRAVMRSKKTTWNDTDLWKQLQQRGKRRSPQHEAANEIATQVQQWMPIITTVLAKGATSPQDFTLHDEDHAYRVAQRMWELVPKTQRNHLSDYEVALLLLGAYLHDIGMCPSRRQVSNVHYYLLTKEDGLLSPIEAADLQSWLDRERDGIVPPLCTAAPAATELALAEEITTYYVRHKHNEWSADWIRENLKENLGDLSDTQTVLIRLCQSHHWDHLRLQQDDFNPRPVGNTNPQRLNLRHLACILRVADILENDPERVPPIIFKHRDIVSSPKSIIHWQMPHQLNIVIKDDRVFLSAQPLAAAAHKAILSLADDIDAELAGCAAIASRLPFNYCPGFNDQKRDWSLAPACHREVKPANELYEYIDGAFRPNTPKLLQLLSGTQLYDTPLASVRELLQNAFDAVREKIARRRLQKENPGDPKWETDLGNHEHVTLTLHQTIDGTLRLTCLDTGCGMTRAIIEKHLLVSGDARRPAVIELERLCETAGFKLGRTGQFGIGVLSYFMLAKSVSIQTCRLQDCGDLDAPGWTFTTTGVGDFGELRRLPVQPTTGAGTLIEWTLDPTQFPDVPKFATGLEKYLREQLIKVPCVFRFQTDLPSEKQTPILFTTGWTLTQESIKKTISEKWLNVEPEAIEVKATDSESIVQDKLAVQSRMEGWLAHASDTLRLEERVIPLPEGCGSARVILPWFDLPEGAALAFVLSDRTAQHLTFKTCRLLRPRAERQSGWHGIRAGITIRKDRHLWWSFLSHSDSNEDFGWVICDFDQLPEQQIQVDRSVLQLPGNIQEACREKINKTLVQLASEVMSRGARPLYYDLLNALVLKQPTSLKPGHAWWVAHGETARFEPISLPFAVQLGNRTADLPFYWGDKKVSFATRWGGIGNATTLLKKCYPERIMTAKLPGKKAPTNESMVVAFWSGTPVPNTPTRIIPFPPEWSHIFAYVSNSEDLFFNKNNWAVKLVENAKLETHSGQMLKKEPDWDMAASTSEPGDVALLLMTCCVVLEHGKWNNLTKTHPSLLPRLWDICAQLTETPREQLVLACFTDHLTKSISLNAYNVVPNLATATAFGIPNVKDPEWLLEHK